MSKFFDKILQFLGAEISQSHARGLGWRHSSKPGLASFSAQALPGWPQLVPRAQAHVPGRWLNNWQVMAAFENKL